MSEVDPYQDLGVFRSAIAERYRSGGVRPPYISRILDARLDDALRSTAFVLVIGPSKAGKSRTAFEACLRMFPNQEIIIPRSAQELVELSRLDQPLGVMTDPVLLWLDNLERFLDAGTLDATQLDHWTQHSPRLIVIATLRAIEHERLRSAKGDIGYQAQLILERAQAGKIRLEGGQPTPDELEMAQVLYPGIRFESGIGEQLTASSLLVERFVDGTSTSPAGAAVVQAAIDWYRCGLTRPISDEQLKVLFGDYLRRIRPHDDATDEQFQNGLHWARQPLESSAALVTRVDLQGMHAYRAFDYIVDYIDQPDSDVYPGMRILPDATWQFALAQSEPAELVSIGNSAYTRGNQRIAEAAWRQGATHDIAMAINNLGVILSERGALQEAEAFYRQAATGYAGAAYNLANLLHKREELAEAEAFYRQAAAKGHIDAT